MRIMHSLTNIAKAKLDSLKCQKKLSVIPTFKEKNPVEFISTYHKLPIPQMMQKL